MKCTWNVHTCQIDLLFPYTEVLNHEKPYLWWNILHSRLTYLAFHRLQPHPTVFPSKWNLLSCRHMTKYSIKRPRSHNLLSCDWSSVLWSCDHLWAKTTGYDQKVSEKRDLEFRIFYRTQSFWGLVCKMNTNIYFCCSAVACRETDWLHVHLLQNYSTYGI